MKTKDSSGNFHNSSILGKHSSKKLSFYVLVFFLLFNFVSTGGHFDSYDGVLYYLVAENVVLNNSIKIDRDSPSIKELEFDSGLLNHVRFWVPEIYDDFHSGEKKSFYLGGSILGPLLAVPWYALSTVLGTNPIHFVAFFTNSVILTLTSLVLFLTAKEYFSSSKIGFVLALIFSITSFVWSYNTSFFLQPAQGLVLISSIYCIVLYEKQKLLYSTLAGVLLGLSVLIHPSSVIFLPGFVIFGILKFRINRSLISFLTTIISISSVQLLVNYVKYSSVSNFGYNIVSSATAHTDWVGLIGLLFSPGWGLVFYFPLSILLPISFYRMFKEDRKLFFLSIYFFLATWLFFGTLSSPHWSGFGSWGPRYFLPFLPIGALALGYLFIKLPKKSILKHSIISLAVIGFVVNILGKLVWYLTGYGYGWGVDKLAETDNSFNYFAWVPYYSPIIEHTKVLLSDYGGLTLNPITKTIGCSVDIFLFCTAGIIPILILLILIVVIAFYILKNLGIKAFKISGFSNNN